MQYISIDKTVTSDTVQDLKHFNSQSLVTPAKKGVQLVSMMPAIKKTFNLMGVDTVELSTENHALKNKISSFVERWLEQSQAKLLEQIDNEKRANLIMSRMKKQIEKFKLMAYISYNNLWESEFDNIVSQRDKLQDLNINQLKT